MNAVHEPCMKFGLTILPRVTKMTRETWQSKAGADIHVTVLEVTYSFFAPDGSSVEACVVGEGMDSGDKSSNKAMSAALKYALGQVLLIAFEVTDSEKDDHQTQGRAAPMGAAAAVATQRRHGIDRAHRGVGNSPQVGQGLPAQPSLLHRNDGRSWRRHAVVGRARPGFRHRDRSQADRNCQEGRRSTTRRASHNEWRGATTTCLISGDSDAACSSTG